MSAIAPQHAQPRCWKTTFSTPFLELCPPPSAFPAADVIHFRLFLLDRRVDDRKNLEHWERWAADYGSDLRATTKCISLKRLEIEALLRQLEAQSVPPGPLVLEIGCGNGSNGLALATRRPDVHYVGLDFSPAMIENA